MRVRGVLALVALVASSTMVGTVAMSVISASPAAATLPDVTVTVIDTGVHVTHQEFDYVSQTDTTDQVVAWWDFSGDASPANHLPAAGELWDTTTNGGEPWDNHGHGTAVASAAVGLNVAGPATKRPSFCPGCKLAIAKVTNGAGAVSLDQLDDAIKWARETVHTDVISMSLGGIAPLPTAVLTSIFSEIRLARQAGILVVVANGNGIANAGVPGGAGFATPFGNSPYALGVGVGVSSATVFSTTSYTSTTDPEVTSDANFVRLASKWCQCYSQFSGTSYAAPIVAGFAARLLQENPAMTPDYLETLVKYSARDSIFFSPVVEGYGTVDGAGAQLSTAIAHAAAGTLPARPSPDVDALYVETVQGTLDDVWADKLAEGSQVIVNPGIGTTSPSGTIGHSAPTGLSDAEVHKVTANAGDVVTVDAGYTSPDGTSDFDVYVLRVEPTASFGLPTGGQMVARSTKAAGVDESVSFVAPSTGDYWVVVLGHAVVAPQAFTITSNKALAFQYESYVLHTFGTPYPYAVEPLVGL